MGNIIKKRVKKVIEFVKLMYLLILSGGNLL